MNINRYDLYVEGSVHNPYVASELCDDGEYVHHYEAIELADESYNNGVADGYAAALRDTREALMAMRYIDRDAGKDYLFGIDDCIAKIDILIEENND